MAGNEDSGLAQVIPLVPKVYVMHMARPVSCFVCIWAVVSPVRTYCSLFTEQIDNESATAQDCDHYEDDRSKA